METVKKVFVILVIFGVIVAAGVTAKYLVYAALVVQNQRVPLSHTIQNEPYNPRPVISSVGMQFENHDPHVTVYKQPITITGTYEVYRELPYASVLITYEPQTLTKQRIDIPWNRTFEILNSEDVSSMLGFNYNFLNDASGICGYRGSATVTLSEYWSVDHSFPDQEGRYDRAIVENVIAASQPTIIPCS